VSFSNAIKRLKNISSANWCVDIHDLNAMGGEFIAGFYTFNPLTDFCTAGFMGKSDFQSLSVNDLAGAVAELHLQVERSRSSEGSKNVSCAMAMYALRTESGKQYLRQFSGMSAAFLAILYPRNSKGTDFYVRPLVIGQSILSTDELIQQCNNVMSVDKLAHPEYFKHLKQ
jgi:hypothetical protein